YKAYRYRLSTRVAYSGWCTRYKYNSSTTNFPKQVEMFSLLYPPQVAFSGCTRRVPIRCTRYEYSPNDDFSLRIVESVSEATCQRLDGYSGTRYKQYNLVERLPQGSEMVFATTCPPGWPIRLH
ncbi:unnamed protein product, partial [Trichogramma brassicae]